MTVPFNDLVRHHHPIQKQLDEVLVEVSRSGSYVSGDRVEQFEKEFAQFCGAVECVAVGSGSDALWLTLMALGIGTGDEVITVPNSFIATAKAIVRCGAIPVFVDVDPETHQMNVEALENVISERTAAIVPVHLYGQPAPLNEIRNMAAKHNLVVIEDAAQAHGAEYEGQLIGGSGISCFSFYPGKNLGAFGEAGAMTTSDHELATKIRRLRNHGQSERYHHHESGWNSRMDECQAAVLSIKLPLLNDWNHQRREIAGRYQASFANSQKLRLPVSPENTLPAHHLYPICFGGRDALAESLALSGIGVGFHYPIPIHLQKTFANLGHQKGNFPVAETIALESLSLPIFPGLTTHEQDHVIRNVNCFLQDYLPVAC